jgi:hypothetical protein
MNPEFPDDENYTPPRPIVRETLLPSTSNIFPMDSVMDTHRGYDDEEMMLIMQLSLESYEEDEMKREKERNEKLEYERIFQQQEREREEQRRRDTLQKEEYKQQMKIVVQKVMNILGRLQYDTQWRDDCGFCLQWIQRYLNQLEISIEMKEKDYTRFIEIMEKLIENTSVRNPLSQQEFQTISKCFTLSI